MLDLKKKIQVAEFHFTKRLEFYFKERQKRKIVGYLYPKVLLFSM